MIPTFQKFNDLHKAAVTGLSAPFDDFYIFRNQSISEHSLKCMYAHRCSFHQVCLDVDSDYEASFDANAYSISNNSLYFVPKGTIITWTSEHDALWSGYTIFFRSEFLGANISKFRSSFFRNGQPSLFSLNVTSLLQLSTFCEQMLTEQAASLTDTRVILQDWFSLFLSYCQRYFYTFKQEEVPYEMSIKYRFQELLSFHIEKQHSVTFYADALNLSPRHFTRLIKKATGKTAKEMIISKIVEVAKAQLNNTEMSISQIAYQLGFKNTPQFNRHFKAFTGKTPSAYRKAS